MEMGMEMEMETDGDREGTEQRIIYHFHLRSSVQSSQLSAVSRMMSPVRSVQ